MQIGIRLHDTRKLPIDQRIEEVKNLGFSCAHMALPMVLEEYPTTDEALTPGLAMYLKKLYAQNQLDVAVLGCYLNLANPDKKQLEKTVHRYMSHIRFASWLGCGVVGTETGAPNETYTFVPECHSEEALQTFISNLRPVIRYAEQMGVVLAIEPVWRHIVNTPARARRVLDEINSPNLSIILDPVNLLDVCNYKDQVAIVDEAIDLLGADVSVVHIKDFVVENGVMRSLGAGFGQMNFDSVIRFMKERKPFIHATLEDTVPENSVQAREFIQKLYREA